MTGPVGVGGWITAGAEVAAGLVVALLLRIALGTLARHAERTRWRGDDAAIEFARVVGPAAAVIGGLWLAMLGLPLESAWRRDGNRALLGLVIVVATLGVARSAVGMVRAGAMARSGVSGSASIFANITRVFVWCVGLLILLDSLGVSITPLLTALGVGGLAVALALQDTLTNLFAGVHILASGKVQPGDYIQLDGGQEGYVVDTNWRNTTIRQLSDNLVVVPNATLADSILTNYHQPIQETSVIVQVGVSYDSDLDHVERVAADVGRAVMEKMEDGLSSYDPLIRFHTFGDSSINMSIILRTAEVTSQYVLKHEFVKALHRRFRTEGIEIPFPIRTLVHAGGPAEPAAIPAPAQEPAES